MIQKHSVIRVFQRYWEPFQRFFSIKEVRCLLTRNIQVWPWLRLVSCRSPMLRRSIFCQVHVLWVGFTYWSRASGRTHVRTLQPQAANRMRPNENNNDNELFVNLIIFSPYPPSKAYLSITEIFDKLSHADTPSCRRHVYTRYYSPATDLLRAMRMMLRTQLERIENSKFHISNHSRPRYRHA
jgi:hypothetical protein